MNQFDPAAIAITQALCRADRVTVAVTRGGIIQ